MDQTGKVVIEPAFEKAWPFSEGIAAVKLGNKFGYIDKTGAFALPARFDRAYPFRDGLARVRMAPPRDASRTGDATRENALEAQPLTK